MAGDSALAAGSPLRPEPPSLETFRRAADDARARARQDVELLHGSRSGRRRHDATGRSRSRRSARRRSPGNSRSQVREQLRSPRRLSPSRSGGFDEVRRASLKATSDAERIGLLAQFIGSTPQGRELEEAVLTQIATRVVAWGTSLHDLPYFTDEDLSQYLSRDPEPGEGPSLSSPGARRGAVVEAVAIARDLFGKTRTAASSEGVEGRLAGPGGRRRTSCSRGRSRSRRAQPGSQDDSPGSKRDLFYSTLLEKFNDQNRRPSQQSEIQAKVHFDITGIRLKPVRGDHSRIDPLSFPDGESIAKLQRDFEVARTVNPRLPYLSTARVEVWQPRWLGGKLSSSARENYVKYRVRKDSDSVSSLCNASLGFWLAHMAVGIVTFQDVACHIFLLLRTCDDYSPAYAILYSNRLISRIHSRISNGEVFNVGDSITRVDMEVLREVDHHLDSVARKHTAPHAPRDPKGGGKGSGKDEIAPPEPRPQSGGPPVRPHKEQICFDHDPSSKKRCKLGAERPRKHLNTLLADEKGRYNKAKASFDSHKKAKVKPS